MKLRFLVWAGAAAVAFAAAGVWAFLNAGTYLDSAGRSPVEAELVVALGGDNGDRLIVASRLYTQGYARYVLLTGLEDAPADTRRQYLNWRAAYLLDQGVPQGAILYDYASTNSWEEAGNTLRLLQQRSWKRVLVVSDPPHLRRLSWSWSRAFAGSGKDFLLVSSEPPWWDAGRWWQQESSAKFVFIEYVKLIYYRFSYL